MTNEQYVKRYRESGDNAYLNLLYYNVEKMLYKISNEYRCDIDELYLGFMKAVKDFDETRGKFITFLYNVCKNEILQDRRKKRVETCSVDKEIGDEITIADVLESDFDLEQVMTNKLFWQECEKHLTETEREILHKYYRQDKTFKVIANEMGMTPRMIQSRHERMLNRLKGVFLNGNFR